MIEIMPPEKAKETVLSVAVDLKLPGSGGGLIDARPSMRQLLDELYRRGYAVALMTDSPVVQKVYEKLNAGQSANLSA